MYNAFSAKYFVYCYVSSSEDTPVCAEEQLPVPGNGSVHCTTRQDDLKCVLACKDMFVFGPAVDVTPQYCRDGVWEFQRDEIEIPDCQGECSFIF